MKWDWRDTTKAENPRPPPNIDKSHRAHHRSNNINASTTMKDTIQKEENRKDIA